MTDRQIIADRAFQSGYNAGVKELLHATKITRIVLSVLVVISIILSAYTAVSAAKFAADATAELSRLAEQMETITAEFRDIAYRVERLENG